MKSRKKPIDKEVARQLRAELYEAINRGELGIQEAVKRMRKISRLTQPEFAAHRGVSAKVIREIERGIGNPTVNTLNRIGQFFGLEVTFVRSERLRVPEGETGSAAASEDVAIAVPAAFSGSPIEDSRRLVEELENIKKMVTPPKFLQDELKKMETELNLLREAEKLIVQTDTQQIANAPSTERAMRGIDAELQAVKNARNILETVEKLQRQILPPPAFKKWLDDIDAAKKLLTPLDPASESWHA